MTPVPAQQRLGPHWYTGSADAIYQSMNLIKDGRPDIVIVFGADHVCRMDPRQMIDQHASNAIAALSTAAPSRPLRVLLPASQPLARREPPAPSARCTHHWRPPLLAAP